MKKPNRLTEAFRRLEAETDRLAKTQPRLKDIAYHEAGHAVAAFALNRRVRSVTVAPQGNILGQNVYGKGLTIQPDVGVDGRTRNEIERRVICAMAGWAVEKKLHPKRKGIATESNDLQHAADLASYVVGSTEELEAYLDWLWIRAKQLIALPHYWAAIEALAAELVTHKRLGEKRVREVINAALRRQL